MKNRAVCEYLRQSFFYCQVIINNKFYAPQLEDHGSMSATELAKVLGISVLLAKERLLTTEKHGKACRDESLEGIRFYPNQFLSKEV